MVHPHQLLGKFVVVKIKATNIIYTHSMVGGNVPIGIYNSRSPKKGGRDNQRRTHFGHHVVSKKKG